jgi:hypothetical protein
VLVHILCVAMCACARFVCGTECLCTFCVRHCVLVHDLCVTLSICAHLCVALSACAHLFAALCVSCISMYGVLTQLFLEMCLFGSVHIQFVRFFEVHTHTHHTHKCAPSTLQCADANDAAQFAELKTQGELTKRAWERGVQVRVCGCVSVCVQQVWGGRSVCDVCECAWVWVCVVWVQV